MAASRLATNLTDDYLTCSICCEIFKDPRQLSCDHSFCLSCLLDYGQKCTPSGQILCPICRTANSCPIGSDFRTWIKTFPSDLLLQAILTTVKNHDSNSLISIDETVFSEKNSEKNICTKHNSNIQDVYCFTHALLLCATCAWIDHGQCMSFPLDDCSDKISEIIRQLKSRSDKLSNRVSHIKQQGGHVKDIIEQCRSRSQASLREIQDALQQFWSKAQLNVQHLAQSIHQRDNDVINVISSVSVIQDDLMNLTQDLGNAYQTGSKIKTLNLLEECERRVKEHDLCLTNIDTSLNGATPFSLDTNADLLNFCSDFRTVGNLKSEEMESKLADFSKLDLSLQKVSVSFANTSKDFSTRFGTSKADIPTSSVTFTTDIPTRSVTSTTDIPTRSVTSTTNIPTRSAYSSTELSETDSSFPDASCTDDDESYVHVAGKRGSLASASSTSLFESFSHRAIHVGDNIRGIFTLSDICIVGDHVIVVDQYNSLVMKFDVSSGVCVDKLTIMEPHHIALIPESRCVLVTCWSLNEIYTVDVQPRLQVKGEPLKTLKHYIGIHVYNRQRMLVSALDKSIDVINFHGHVIHSIRPRYQTRLSGILGGGCILVPADICLLSEDSILVLDGVRKSIVAVHFSGKTLWSKHIEGISGFTVFNGKVYVCSSKTNTVMTLNGNGKIIDRHFLSRFVGIKHPWALDVHENMIVVSEDSPSGTFHVVIVES
ncbi:tripartite motif-containing protein 2-like [Pecten maximus]|uniref:tripartite motif-containing protein 2-like n=1 Tax=Pecten maximus TaxID=6579 RepID=UPI0014590880|nr:tripartite motif-containing protein 2-like [Pecten maximus]